METSGDQLRHDPDASTPAGREAIAAALVAAWRERSFVDAPSRSAANFSLAEAQAIAERVRALRMAAGAKPVGYKVGFTNAAVRAQFDAAGPMAAPVYDQTLATTARLDARGLLGPRIEPEVVVGIGADGDIAWAALGFEIVQSHVAAWNFGYLDTVVDFGLHAALFVGERQPIDAGDRERLTTIAVRLTRNGVLVESGSAADVDGGAPGSIRWLRDDLRRVGRELAPGEIVTTGSMTRVPAIFSGERWTIETLGGELPPLTIEID
jgi:2-keto-4-pentenoate hydratase